MKKTAKTIGFFLLGLTAYLALICSIAAACVTNEALIKEGFRQYAQAQHLGVSPTDLDAYATAVADQLKGRTETAVLPDPENPGQLKNAFSEKENRHLSDVRQLVNALIGMRYAGGGAALAVLLVLYLFGREKKGALFLLCWQGFARAALALLLLALVLGVWALCDFRGLFWAFHQIAFSNDLWLLDPRTDLLVALMPLGFFTWYGGILLKNLLPILGVMLCVLISWLRMGKNEMKKAS